MPTGSIPFPFGDCRICGDKATGAHYGVNSCEGCKGFFKRSLAKNVQYHCKYNGRCNVSLRKRIGCKACRFKRCVDQGMSLQSIRMGRIPKKLRDFALQEAGKSSSNDELTVDTLTQQKHSRPLEEESAISKVEVSSTKFEEEIKPSPRKKVSNFASSCTEDITADPYTSPVKNLCTANCQELSETTAFFDMLINHYSTNGQTYASINNQSCFKWLTELQTSRHMDPGVLSMISKELLELGKDFVDIQPVGTDLPQSMLVVVKHLDRWFYSQLLQCRNTMEAEQNLHLHSTNDQLRSLILSRLFLGHRLSCLAEYRDYLRLQQQIEAGVELNDCIPKGIPVDTEVYKLFLKHFLNVVVIFSKKTTGFMLQMPGCHLVPHEVKVQLTKEGIHAFWILSVYRLFWNGDYHLYTCDGAGKYSLYWMQHFVEQGLINKFLQMSKLLREYEITDMQTAALLAYYLTNPNLCPAYGDPDKILQRLHSFYFNLLLWSLEDDTSGAGLNSKAGFPVNRSAKQAAFLDTILPLLMEMTEMQRLEIGEMKLRSLMLHGFQ